HANSVMIEFRSVGNSCRQDCLPMTGDGPPIPQSHIHLPPASASPGGACLRRPIGDHRQAAARKVTRLARNLPDNVSPLPPVRGPRSDSGALPGITGPPAPSPPSWHGLCLWVGQIVRSKDRATLGVPGRPQTALRISLGRVSVDPCSSFDRKRET